MIAANYRKYPEAMALQRVLPLGKPVWATSRPTTNQTRTIRAERGRIIKVTPQIVQWAKKIIPSWWKKAKDAAKELAKKVKAAIWNLDFTQEEEQENDQTAERKKFQLLISNRKVATIKPCLDADQYEQDYNFKKTTVWRHQERPERLLDQYHS